LIGLNNLEQKPGIKNVVKEKWAAGRCVSNAWLTIPNSWTAEIASRSGYDVVTIDAQHGFSVCDNDN
jgi:2-keto-3-deoxy-L-rhamnonate aldolase RhmA